jgi:hypothetical protein
MDIEPQSGIIVKMKSIDDLRNECRRIQLEIKQLLLDHYRYDQGLAKQLNVVNKVHSMRETLAAAQREMREKLGS